MLSTRALSGLVLLLAVTGMSLSNLFKDANARHIFYSTCSYSLTESVAGHEHHHLEDIDQTVPFDAKIWIHVRLLAGDQDYH
jgi:hypothetical protein